VAEAPFTIPGFDGVNQSVRPDKIGNTQLAGAVNVTLVNGLRPRLKFHEQGLRVITTKEFKAENGKVQSYQSLLNSGKFQMSADYYTDQGVFNVVVIAGVIFKIDLDACTAEILNDTFLNEYVNRYNWSHAGRFLVIYDDPQRPLIIDNDVVRRSVESDYEVPVSNIGTYNQFRLAVANRFNNFVVGDPSAKGFPDGPVSFTEVLTPSASRVGQFFSVGDRPFDEPITYMGNLQRVDASTEIGPLVVSVANQIWAYRTDVPANQWEELQNFGTIIISNHGIAGARAAVNVGFDFLYTSTESDIRSLNTARQQQGSWANVSISEDIKEYIGVPERQLLNKAVAGYFKNRLLFTVQPYRIPIQDTCGNTTYDIAFKGLAVLETATQSGLAGIAPPKWAGIWTEGTLSFMEMTQIKGRFYLWCKSGIGNKLVELVDHKFDFLNHAYRKVVSRIYSRELGAEEGSDKNVVNVIAEVEDIDLQIGFEAKTYFKPGHASHFTHMQTVKYSTDDKSLNQVGTSFKELNLGGAGKLNKACDAATKASYAVFKKGQLLLELTGDWVLDSVIVNMQLLPASGTPEFKCDVVTNKVNTLDCDKLISDYYLMSEKVGHEYN